MKKILVISQHFPPEIGAASNRVAHIIRHLIAHNYLVYLITSHPNYPESSLYKGDYSDKLHSQLKIYRSPVIRNLKGKWARFINQIIFLCYAILIAFFVCVRYSIKICLTTSPPFLVNLVGLSLGVVLRRKWIMEVRDLWPDSMVAVGAIKQDHIFYKWLKQLELLFYRCSQHVVVVTEESKRLLNAEGIKEEKVSVVPNGIPDWVRQAVIKKKSDCRETKESKTFNVVYAGNIGLSQNLRQIIDVAEQLQYKEHIQFFLIGEGLEKNKLRQEVKQRKLGNVHFVKATTNKEELINWYSIADLGLVCLRQSPLFKTVIPSKIFEYGGMRVPILYIGEGEASRIIEKYRLGHTVNHDPVAIKQAILNATKGNWKENQDTVAYETFINEFSWDALIKKYISILVNAVNSNGNTRNTEGVDK